MKNIIQRISSFFIVRLFTISFLRILSIYHRVLSNLKFRALVSKCGNSICHYTTEIKYGKNITIGDNTRIGPNCTLGAKGGIVIGENVVLSKYVTIETAGLDLETGPPYNSHKAQKITIEDGVWIGTNSIILGGVTIGKNSIIGAGTVITKDVFQNSIIVGSSSRKLK